ALDTEAWDVDSYQGIALAIPKGPQFEAPSGAALSDDPIRILHRSRHRQRIHRFFEHSPAMFVALELIKTGAGRSQKNHVACDGRFTRASDSIFQSFRMVDFDRALNLRFDLRSRGPDGVHALHPLPQQLIEQAIVASLILAPENQMQVWRSVRRERFQR